MRVMLIVADSGCQFVTNGLITKDDPVRGESMAALWKWMERQYISLSVSPTLIFEL